MKIKVDKLKNVSGIRSDLNFSLSKEDVGDKIDLNLSSAPLVLRGTVENADRIIKITATVAAVLQLHCDRCGEPLDYRVEADVRENFSNLPEHGEGEDSDEVNTHFFQGDEIDLSTYVEQAIFLKLPMKVLCRENCKGLCPQCGQNLNLKKCSCDNTPIDPRLAVLADLLKETD